MFSPRGMIVREREPLNLEMPFGSLDGFITPVDRFFVRSHFSVPPIDVKTWRLKIEGEVETPFELTHDEVREMETRTRAVTMECAGQVKAQIARPGFADAVRAGQTYPVRRAAWTSEAEISKVEISTDGGETWHDTQLRGEAHRQAWRLWDYEWKVPTQPGKATLIARATDSAGRTQPTERDPDRRSYIVNHLQPIEVEVR